MRKFVLEFFAIVGLMQMGHSIATESWWLTVIASLTALVAMVTLDLKFPRKKE